MSHSRTVSRGDDGSVLIDVKSDTTTHHPPKMWDVDPQRQMIDLLKEIKVLLTKIAADSVPYHTGPQTVSLADPPSPPSPPSSVQAVEPKVEE